MLLLTCALLLCPATPALKAQKMAEDSISDNLQALTNAAGVTGYESAVSGLIERQLAPLHPHRDALGDMMVTFGSGAPHRLIVAPIDEPGYVVSRIQPDGYLRVQVLPQGGLPPHYNELQNAQPLVVGARDARTVPAVMAGLSIHLEPGRKDVPDTDDPEHLFVDMGAQSPAEVRQSGVDVLSPVAAARRLLPVGATEWTGTAVGDRFGATVLLELARALAEKHPQGTVTLAFAVQQWSGARGLTSLLERLQPDELIYLGRGRKAPAARSAGSPPVASETPQPLGSGVWSYPVQTQARQETSTGSNDDVLLKEMQGPGVDIHTAPAFPLLPRSYGSAVPLPRRAVHLGIPLLYPLTGGETLDQRDLTALFQTVAAYLGVKQPSALIPARTPMPYAALPLRPATPPAVESVLETLTTTYGVSGYEAMPRRAVEQLLPAWAHPRTDASGNLILQFGSPSAGQGTVFMAHTDELGFRVRAVLPDGSLDLENKGGGSPAFYWGHPAVVHTSAGMRGAVVELPEGWDTPQFKFPIDFRVSAKLHVGADSPQAVAALGIKVGDTVTTPKTFLHLAGSRVSIRSLDDRVGCAAMVRAVWDLGPAFKRNVTFVWSTREELGLEGAGEYAAAAAKAGDIPATVFAIDTFVSSDSPLESHRFADAPLGSGFVIRAIDNSNITPWAAVQRLQSVASAHGIPVQYGITGGGNDGSAFLRYGSVDVPLSWPLRYSHSPAELIDTRDLDALTAITTALAQQWPQP